MRKSLFTIALAIFLLVVPVSGQVQLDSVVKLNGVTPGNPNASCTAFAIGARKWITSTHCLSDIKKQVPTIDGDPVFIMAERAGASSISTMKVTGRPLPLAKVAPKKRDPVYIDGFPFGFPKAIATAGVVSIPAMVVPEREDFGDRLIVNAMGAPGSSGSPVLNTNNEVIGVVEWGWGRELSTLLAATPWEALKEIW